MAYFVYFKGVVHMFYVHQKRHPNTNATHEISSRLFSCFTDEARIKECPIAIYDKAT